MDLFSPGFADDPHPAYHRMQAECPVQRAPGMFGGHSVNLSRYEDVMWALRHPEVFSSKDVVNVGNDMPLIPLSVDPPDHAQVPAPARSRVLAHQDGRARGRIACTGEPHHRRVRRRAASASSTKTSRRRCRRRSSWRSIGLPQTDLPQFLQWRDDTIRPDATNPEEAQQIREAAGHAITAYFETALEEKRRNPDDRLLSRIVTAEVDGRPLTQAEMLGMCHLLLLGGLDTVTATLDCMIAYLAEHPERRRAVVADPELMNAAIEELLRHQTPVMMVPQDPGAGHRDGRRRARGRRRGDAAARRRELRRGRVRQPRRRAARSRVATVTWRSAAARTAASARTSRAWSSASRWRSSTSAFPSTSSPRAPRSTSRPESARPTACRWSSRPRSVRAAVLRAPGAQFEVTDLTLRALGPRDVHVQVAASGVCRSDLSIQDGTIPHPLPAVLGHEGAGVVLEVGDRGHDRKPRRSRRALVGRTVPGLLLLPARPSGAVRARSRPCIRDAVCNRRATTSACSRRSVPRPSAKRRSCPKPRASASTPTFRSTSPPWSVAAS